MGGQIRRVFSDHLQVKRSDVLVLIITTKCPSNGGLVHVTSLVIFELLFLCSNQFLINSTVEIFLKSDLETQSDRK